VAGGGKTLGSEPMSEPLLLGIDEGTTAVKVALFDTQLQPLGEARRSLTTAHPGLGLVEQDPLEILEAIVAAVAEVLEGTEPGRAIFAGLAHQGESVLAWDARSGAPLTPLIVWQDKRQTQLLETIDPTAVSSSGLPLDPYFSAGKLTWLIRNDAAVARAAESGTLRMGTVDSFIAERLGGRFATDLSTASRTQLLAVGGRDWDRDLLETFGLRDEWLPALGASYGRLGCLRSERWPLGVSLAAQLVDQQAALVGSGTVAPGQVKATYGTGVFVLGRTDGPDTAPGLLPTVAWSAPDDGPVAYALDGGVFAAGALLDWLSEGLGLARDAPALAACAAEVPDSAGVMLLPALAGLGAPWWQPAAHGVISGLHAGVGPAHIARAALEAIAWRVADIVEAMSEVAEVGSLAVDGGLTNDATLLQIQADALGLPLAIGQADTTVLGAAMLAGVGGGVFSDVPAATKLLPAGRVIKPQLGRDQRQADRIRWREFVERAAGL
jgi:glycerol kinase